MPHKSTAVKLKMLFMAMFVTAMLVPASLMAAETFSVQLGVFSIRQNAQQLVDALSTKGISCSITQANAVSKVMCGSFSAREGAERFRDTLRSMGYKDAFISKPMPSALPKPSAGPAAPVYTPAPVYTAPAPIYTPEPLAIPAFEPIAPAPVYEPVPAPASASAVPAPKSGITGDVFEKEGGHFHPYLKLTEMYTDNVFATKNADTDYVTTLTGGIWFAAPGNKQKMTLNSSGAVPGGTSSSSLFPESKRMYQVYMLYEASAEEYSKFTEADATSHKAEGVFLYNLRGGHKFKLGDIYLNSLDKMGEGISSERGKFTSNRVETSFVLKATEKSRLRADVAVYQIEYDETANAFKNRADDMYTGYAYYDIFPKTSMYLQFNLVRLNYKSTSEVDSTEQDYLIGIQWDVTDKTTGNFKSGFTIRDYPSSYSSDDNDYKVIADISFNFTPKTSMNIGASRQRKETDVDSARFIMANSAYLSLSHKFTPKISLTGGGNYSKSEYDGLFTYNDVTGVRDDTLYSGNLKLSFVPVDWFDTSLEYTYEKRSSTFNDLEYNANKIILVLSASL